MKASEMLCELQEAYRAKYSVLDDWVKDVLYSKFLAVYPKQDVSVSPEELPCDEEEWGEYLHNKGFFVFIDTGTYGRDLSGTLVHHYTVSIPLQGEK